jgi:hypothetical protein
MRLPLRDHTALIEHGDDLLHGEGAEGLTIPVDRDHFSGGK